jgi:translation initiation factor 2 beta subunit (eIF-2beta)/eIF-5
MNEKEQMKLDMVKHLALRLMGDEPQLSMEQALSIVINSDTYQRLQRDATGLYHQSPGYVYSFLQNELKTAKVS